MNTLGGVNAHVHRKAAGVCALLVGGHGEAPWIESLKSDYGRCGWCKRV
jgi:hypothetical protein